MSDPCEFGCTVLGKHRPGCVCSSECPDDCPDHCVGCTPKPAEHGWWCRRCYSRQRRNVSQLSALIEETALMPGGRVLARARDGSDPSRRATKVDQQSLSPAYDLAEDAGSLLASWALLIADEAPDAADPFHLTTAGVVARQPAWWAGYVITHLEFIATHWARLDFVNEVRSTVRTLELATGQDQLVHRMTRDRCPICEQKSLVREDGSGQVECHNADCRRIWRQEEWDTLVRWSTKTGDAPAEPEQEAS